MKRSDFLKTLLALPLMDSLLNVQELHSQVATFASTDRMPALFIGHGNPMNAIWDNDFTKHLQKLGRSIQPPQAILVVSAHWETSGTFVSINAAPQTIYDFGGFPDEMYHIKYAAPGSPQLAKAVSEQVKATHVQQDPSMGLDHGAWTILKHLYPAANIPVFQLSLDYSKSPEYHFQLAKELAFLRTRGVLVIGSGNIVHNLRRVVFSDVDAKPFDWAVEFDETVKSRILSRDFESLVHYDKLGAAAKLSIPSNEHYLPMLYTLALAEKNDSIRMVFEGIQNGSISMRCFQVG